jgi:hypothetical protein
MISVFENKWHTRTTDQRGTRGHRGRDRMVVGADFTLNNNQTFQRFISKGTKTNLCSSFGVRFMVFNATFNNSSVISWLSVLLQIKEEQGAIVVVIVW